MFRTAELGRAVSKQEFNAIAPDLRIEVVEMQQALRHADFPVIVVFAGVNGAGKGESINLLNEWMDPRWIVTRAYGELSDEERERPEYWRYWRDLPAKGLIGLFLSSWYSRPILDRVFGHLDEAAFDERLARIATFERTLADDGALFVKFWMHLGRQQQKARLKALEKDPNERWRVGKTDWEHWKRYDDFVAAAERTLMQTSKEHASWTIVEGQDPRYRSLSVLTTLRDCVHRHLERRAAQQSVAAGIRAKAGKAAPAKVADSPALPPQPTVLDALDMTQSLGKKAYAKAFVEQRARLAGLYREAKARGLSSVLVFEGWDAAGKGGAIRRLVTALDARDYQVLPVAAPTDEERARHYLWRFWRHLSRAGRFTIFDRSWYGRVLVERVEGFASEDAWRRAYAEINDFEEQLVRSGIVLLKYWVHITSDEQHKRFKAREAIPYKRWKLTDEDWRNREKWDDYVRAIDDMVEQTSTRIAPWTIVEGNCKRFARIKVIEECCRSLEARLNGAAPGGGKKKK